MFDREILRLIIKKISSKEYDVEAGLTELERVWPREADDDKRCQTCPYKVAAEKKG